MYHSLIQIINNKSYIHMQLVFFLTAFTIGFVAIAALTQNLIDKI